MKALTVRQPWAWAIVAGFKDVENRTQAWSYRGPLAIHAGAQLSQRGVESELIQHATSDASYFGDDPATYVARSAIIGVVNLVGAHTAEPGCCESEWAEHEYREAGGRVRREIAHLVLENPREFRQPLAARGRLGLWTPSHEQQVWIEDQLRSAR